ncbi:PASTA domain-containing protein [Micromonospora sp. ALFpr18c]|nr:PASTA domain-containing protein [Micromonospora sp. ALFpr18c]
MPNLAGSNAAVAQDKLKRLGITNIKLGSQDEFDTLVILPENWTVKKQSQKAGAKVAQDELVVLTCTKTG